MEQDVLTQLSRRVAALGAEGAAHVVRVDGRRHAPASGVIWSADGVVVGPHHAIPRDDGVSVGLPSGETVAADLVGRDPSTDLAVLRLQAGAALVAEAVIAAIDTAQRLVDFLDQFALAVAVTEFDGDVRLLAAGQAIQSKNPIVCSSPRSLAA